MKNYLQKTLIASTAWQSLNFAGGMPCVEIGAFSLAMLAY
jgi:hypothetical protein